MEVCYHGGLPESCEPPALGLKDGLVLEDGKGLQATQIKKLGSNQPKTAVPASVPLLVENIYLSTTLFPM